MSPCCPVMSTSPSFPCTSLHFLFAPENPNQQRAGRGIRAWDPCFGTPAPRRLCLVERHQITARYVLDPPPNPTSLTLDGLGGGVILYPFLSIRHASTISADNRLLLESKGYFCKADGIGAHCRDCRSTRAAARATALLPRNHARRVSFRARITRFV